MNNNNNNNPNNYRAIAITNNQSRNEAPVYRSLATLTIPKQQQTSPSTTINNNNIVPIKLSRSSNNIVVEKQQPITNNNNNNRNPLTNTNSLFTPRDLSSVYPLCQSHVFVQSYELDNIVEIICNTLKDIGTCVVKPEKGVIRISGEKLDIKICFFTLSDGKVVCEFNRMNGCACVFQREYLKTLCAASRYIESMDSKLCANQLASIERRLSLFPGKSCIPLENLSC